ncbi:MAG: DUF805 domain-containing protein [Clostridia bacterium]|nr:DUF805 domain-containing protein [Clostridia bacterium]
MIKNFVYVIKNWKNWFGRATRTEYWLFRLCSFIITIVAFSLAFAFGALGFKTPSILMYVAAYAYAVLQVIPSIALEIRRLHDTGRGGGWYFIRLVPYCGTIWAFVLTLLPGTKGGNQFGPDPRDSFIPQDSAATYSEYTDFSGKE